ncbi:hypothetical protein C8A01DRAFT_51243 [Parachaetomium inaequale]|uniref:Aminoglycoside phosphotransferase domain-containing protein n=1 Tax=Parachaetomium inaequale TaxID=2588326 RepID=A0AAN6P989_9PEZI|nr:hypothetical protein C8A01DRAFT_51243 [Parachaetomium inaequale]
MPPLSQAEEQAIANRIVEELSQTPYSLSSITQLHGSTANFVFHSTLVQPLPAEDDSTATTVIIKHSTEFVAIIRDFPLINTQVLEDLPGTNDLKTAFFLPNATDLLPGSSPLTIGHHLGSWLRSETLETLVAVFGKEFEKPPGAEADKHWGMIHGDFWSGNLIGDLWERKIFNDLDIVMPVVQGVIEGYGEVSEELAFRAAIHAGVQLISWYSRRPWSGALMPPPKVIIAGLTIGRGIILKAWEQDRKFFEHGVLASLFAKKG